MSNRQDPKPRIVRTPQRKGSSAASKPGGRGSQRRGLAWPEMALIGVVVLIVILGSIVLFQRLGGGSDEPSVAKADKPAAEASQTKEALSEEELEELTEEELEERASAGAEPESTADSSEEESDEKPDEEPEGGAAEDKPKDGEEETVDTADPNRITPKPEPATEEKPPASENPRAEPTDAEPEATPDKPATEEKPEEPVTVASKDPEPTPPPKPADPFRELGPILDVPPLLGDATEPVAVGQEVPLGKIDVPEGEGVRLELLGREVVLGKSGKFVINATGGADVMEWPVLLVDKDETPHDAALFAIKDGQLVFAWRSDENKVQLDQLRNCVAKFSIGLKSQTFPLRVPLSVAPLAVKIETKGALVPVSIASLPDEDEANLQIEILGASEAFGEPRYSPGQTVAVGEEMQIIVPDEQGKRSLTFELRATARGNNLTISAKPMLKEQNKKALIPFKPNLAAGRMNQLQQTQRQLEAAKTQLDMAQKQAKSPKTKARVTLALQENEKLTVQVGQEIAKLQQLSQVCTKLHESGQLAFRVVATIEGEQVELARSTPVAAPAAAEAEETK